jgi:hypothetical protein
MVGLLRLLRMRAAAVLHPAWSAVLFAMLLMPVLPSIVPAQVPVPGSAGGLLGAAPRTKEPLPDVVGRSTQASSGSTRSRGGSTGHSP